MVVGGGRETRRHERESLLEAFLGHGRNQLHSSGRRDGLLLAGRRTTGAMEVPEQIDKIVIEPAGHSDDEFERLTAAELDCLQRLQIVQTQQPAIGHQDQAAHRRKARQDGRQGGNAMSREPGLRPEVTVQAISLGSLLGQVKFSIVDKFCCCSVQSNCQVSQFLDCHAVAATLDL